MSGGTIYLVKWHDAIDSAWMDEDDAKKQAATLGDGWEVDEFYAWASFDEYLEAVGE